MVYFGAKYDCLSLRSRDRFSHISCCNDVASNVMNFYTNITKQIIKYISGNIKEGVCSRMEKILLQASDAGQQHAQNCGGWKPGGLFVYCKYFPKNQKDVRSGTEEGSKWLVWGLMMSHDNLAIDFVTSQ